jgi:hypothetical protein
VSDSTYPTLDEIQSLLADLAHRVVANAGPTLDLGVRDDILRVIDDLERFIPGLDPPSDLDAARQLAATAAGALVRGRPRIALARALRGLSHAPHHAELHYVASSACFELAAPTEAVRLLAHTLWINPGHEKARCEMDALTASDETGVWWAPDDESEDDRAA